MKTIISSVLTGCLCLAVSGSAVAQEDSALIIPVELFTCNYNDGKGAADLDKAVAKWSEWADKNGTEGYSAWTLTPYYYGPDQTFDVIWMGAAKDAITMGKGQDAYMNEDAGIRAGFADVLSCNAHVNYASFNHKALPDDTTPGNSVLTFSDCNYKEGATFDALNAAMGEWSQHLSDGGSKAAIFHWYPAYGGGSEEYDFKWLEAHQSFAELGADYERYGNGLGYETNRKLFRDLIECDGSRAYVAQNRRYVQLR